MEPIKLFTVLVPTIRRKDGKPYRTRYHKVWDKKVRAISGGLTILKPSKGQWLDNGRLYEERMIPVLFTATEEQRAAILQLTAEYYDQLVVMCWEVSNNVTMYENMKAERYGTI